MDTSYSDIRTYCNNFATALDASTGGQGLAERGYVNDIFAVKMDRSSLDKILNMTECSDVAALIGMDGSDNVVISLLALDPNGNVLASEISGDEPGQQGWGSSVIINDMSIFLP